MYCIHIVIPHDSRISSMGNCSLPTMHYALSDVMDIIASASNPWKSPAADRDSQDLHGGIGFWCFAALRLMGGRLYGMGVVYPFVRLFSRRMYGFDA